MKKIVVLLVLGLIMLASCNSKGCNKVEESQLNNLSYGEVDFYVCGLYLQVEDLGSKTLDDANPKIYFSFDDDKTFGFINTKTGYGSSAVSFASTQRSVNNSDSYTLYDARTYFEFVNEEYSSVQLFQIRLVDGKYEVLTTVSETVNTSTNGKYRFVNSFTYNKNKYKVQIELQY